MHHGYRYLRDNPCLDIPCMCQLKIEHINHIIELFSPLNNADRAKYLEILCCIADRRSKTPKLPAPVSETKTEPEPTTITINKTMLECYKIAIVSMCRERNNISTALSQLKVYNTMAQAAAKINSAVENVAKAYEAMLKSATELNDSLGTWCTTPAANTDEELQRAEKMCRIMKEMALVWNNLPMTDTTAVKVFGDLMNNAAVQEMLKCCK